MPTRLALLIAVLALAASPAAARSLARPGPVVQTPADQTPGPPPGARILATTDPLPISGGADYIALKGDRLYVRVFTCPQCRRQMGHGFLVDLSHAGPADVLPVLALLGLDPAAADWTSTAAWLSRAGSLPVGQGRDAVGGRWSDCGLSPSWAVRPVGRSWVLEGSNVRGRGPLGVGALVVEPEWSDTTFVAHLPRPPVAGDELRFSDERGSCSLGTVGPDLWPRPSPAGPLTPAATLLLGGLYGPDHQDPKAWAELRSLLDADPQAPAEAIDAELGSPRATPDQLVAWNLLAPLTELRGDPVTRWLAPRIWGHIRAAALGRRGPLTDAQAQRLAAAQGELEVWMQDRLGASFGWSATGWSAARELGGLVPRAWPVHPEQWASGLSRAVTPAVYLAGVPAERLRMEAGQLVVGFPKAFDGLSVPLSVAMHGLPTSPNGLALDGSGTLTSQR